MRILLSSLVVAAIEILLTVAVAGAAAAAQSEFVETQNLVAFDPPLTSGQVAVSTADDTVWILHPEGYLLRRTSVTEDDGKGRLVRIRTQRTELPASLSVANSELILNAVSGNAAWLVDRVSRRLWRVRGSAWEGPWLFGEEIGGAAAAAADRLIINTPSNTTHPFAVVGEEGRVISRFGEPMRAPSERLHDLWNRWAIATLDDGRIVAAHRYSGTLRIYSRSHDLDREWAADFPDAPELSRSAADAVASIAVDPGTCCWETRLVVAASRVLPIGEDRFAVQYGASPRLEEFDSQGRWRSTTPLRVESREIRSIAPQAESMIVATALGIARLEKVRVRSVEGVVVSEGGPAVTAAQLSFAGSSGVRFVATTGSDGRFTVSVPDREEVYDLTVSAPGHRPWRYRGSLAEIHGRRIALRRLLVQCVRVSDAATGGVIPEFELTIRHEEIREGRQQRSMLSTRIQSSDGKGCIESPFELPWSLEVSADGYAVETLVVKLLNPGRFEAVELSRGVMLEVTVHDRTGGGIETVALRLEPQEVPGGGRELNATTGADGVALFRGLNEGVFRLEGSHERFVPFSRSVTIDKVFTAERIEAEPGTTLSIDVTSGRGAVEGATATLELSTAVSPRVLQCTTDSSGSCSIHALGPGRYDLRVRAEGLGTGQRPVEIASEEELSVEVRLDETLRLSGRIENRGEYAALDLEVMVSRPGTPFLTAPVDPSGQFVMENAPSGVVNVRVAERNRNSTLLYQRLTIPSGRDSHFVTLRLPPPVELSGSIRYRGTGCGDCTLTLERAGAEVDLPSIRANVNAMGSYSVRLPGSGRYLARAAAPDGISDDRILEVSAGTTVHFDLSADQTTVVVKDEGGRAVRDARVQVIDSAHGVQIGTAVTDGQGMATLPLSRAATIIATAGNLSGSAVYAPGSSRRVEVVVRAGSVFRIDLRTIGGALIYRANVRIRSSRTGRDLGVRPLARSDESPFELVAEGEDLLDLVIKADRFAYRTVYGVSHQGISAISLRGGLTLAIGVSPAIQPCAVQFTAAGGRLYGVSANFPLGPVPLTVREAMFNPLEPGEYTVTLFTCTGETRVRQVRLEPGYTTPFVFFD
jgi:hypothetical protein